MPIRTEIVISIGEILECLPPGKAYRKRRYNSFDENQCLEEENEENLWPGGGGGTAAARTRLTCDSPPPARMKPKENGNSDPGLDPHQLPIRRTRCSVEGRKGSVETAEDDEEDGEVTFNPDSMSNGDSAASKSKAKRKSSAEKFLEDNSNYFQLEVLAAKTRSSKILDDIGTSGNNGSKQDFHNSFLDFLKSKEVDDDEEEVDEDDEDSDLPAPRTRHKSGPAADRRHRNGGGEYSPSPARSDSTDSPRRHSRGDSSESPRPHRARGHNSKPRSMSRLRSRSREFSLSESEADTEKSNLSIPRKENCSLESSDDESSNASSGVEKRDKNCNSFSPSKRSRRSELDKLLEAVDTSFHFETAAAAAKRLSDNQSELGPLEIDVSDSNISTDVEEREEKKSSTKGKAVSENSAAPSNTPAKKKAGRKRKHSEIEGAREKPLKRRVNRGNLLKTLSPAMERGARPEVETDNSAEALESIVDQLADVDGQPVNLEEIYFSFECPPMREAWFQTYSRQDRGDDVVYYPDSKIFPFPLPYELPLSTFMPYRPEIKMEGIKSKGDIKRELEMPASTKKSRNMKVSESESTDSENNNRRLKSKFGLKADHLQDLHPRVSPRCHASTKDDSNYPFPNGFDETSNDSVCSTVARSLKQESTEDYLTVATSIDDFIRSATGIKVPDPAKVGTDEPLPNVPTRSRISSDQLLKNMKPKKKKGKRASAEVVMDNFVTENIDSILLDCLEDELPTVPLELNQSDLMSLVTTYQSCNSMNVCNSRWLRPSRPTLSTGGGEQGGTGGTGGSGGSAAKSSNSSRNLFFPGKPKRLVIYKEDLPGFKFDNDIESEKLPISKRTLAKKVNAAAKKEKDDEDDEPCSGESTAAATTSSTPVKKETKEKETKTVVKKEPKDTPSPGKKGGGVRKKEGGGAAAKKSKVKSEVVKEEAREEEEEDDNSSVASAASLTSRKKKINKTGFPPTKKKKVKLVKKKILKKDDSKKEDTKKEENNKKDGTPPPKRMTTAAKSPKIKAKKSPTTPTNAAVKKDSSPTTTPTTTSTSGGSTSTKAVKDKKKKVKIKKAVKSSPDSSRQSVRSNHSSLGRRSTTLKSKNYSELESDTESLLEAKVPYRSPHMKAALLKQQTNKLSKTKSKPKSK